MKKPKRKTAAQLRDQRVWLRKNMIITRLSVQVDGLRSALADLIVYWDRRDAHGWTAADVKRLDEIRELSK